MSERLAGMDINITNLLTKQMMATTMTLSSGGKLMWTQPESPESDTPMIKNGEWRVTSTEGTTWIMELKHDGKGEWEENVVEWLDDDCVKIQRVKDDDGKSAAYLKRKK
jgi:hypothetical protein